MLSIRSIARSVPRSALRLANSSSKSARTASLCQSAFKLSTPKFAAAFSTSRQCCEAAGETDAELIAKVESELEMEKEMRDEDEVPTSVKDYLENGPFEIQDTPGQDEVVLTRKFGGES